MSQITCLRCKATIDASAEQCPACGERVTSFQRTYSSRLIDGKYQILDRLGVGGMGEIFKVRHIHLNELRVIKIMRPNVAADDQGMQRFLQEARTSTMIKHRNLAMLYDFAQLDDGSYYMVWEFIDGTNIQKWMSQNGAVPPRLTVEISIQALHGLDHLHSMGLIHRDISPENIMLSQDHHGKLLVKVIDFGIAKSLAEGESGQGLTQTGMFLGKLKYASPEQAGFLKEGEHLDPRSDLYSFGIVMYEMLAGRAPFQATNPHGYILKHVTEKPVSIHEMNPDAKPPAQLESIIMKSLEKSRDNRFASAAEFAEALESVRGSIPPDQKYGLGEKLVTLSGAKTLADLSKLPTGAYTQRTAAGGPTPTRVGGDEATVMERGITQQTAQTMSGSAPTVMERKANIGSDEATVMERGVTAAPTVMEAKANWAAGGAAAEPTVIERQIAPPSMQKSKTPLYAGIAAVLVIALGVGGYMMMTKGSRQAAPAATATGTPSGAEVISTAPGGGTLPG
ncbi:MAG TPA: serine/threonine-protein kinase, partial [Thermoanaerobaculia bacterium]|nr:serine/threonine-protein kinase [Thermoanaerobaculia bacterium]